MGVGGGQQVGGQHRARDGAGAGHHHLGHCGMWYLLALLSSSMLHNSHLSRSPSMCLCVKSCRMFESAPTSSGFLEVRREPGLSLQMILLPSLALEWQQLVARPGYRGWLGGSPDEDVARAGDGDPHPHHALPQLPGPAARRPAQLGPLLGHSPPTGQTPAANMVILIPSAGSGLG